jgi:drug/metabolite transporter (DMT)-like permease
MPPLNNNVTIALSYCAVCVTWGTTYLAMRVAVAGDRFPPLLFAGIQMLSAGVGLLIMGLSAGEGSRMAFHRSTVWAMAYLVVFGSIIGYGCNLYLLKVWSASKAVTSSYVNPVVAVIAGALILKEPVSGLMLVSMAAIIGSVVLFHVSGKIRINQKSI